MFSFARKYLALEELVHDDFLEVGVDYQIIKEFSIKIESAIEIVSIKSNIPLGNGTIIIVKIAIIKKTIPRSFDPIINLKSGLNNSMLDDFFLANLLMF